jgi:RNA polymerase sigma-70 factor (ECF subfamily)
VLNAITAIPASERSTASERLDRLMMLHAALVLRTALRLLGHYEDAQDASQEVFLRLYRQLGRIDEASVEAWLYRTTVNVCLDALRRRGREIELDFEPVAPGAGDSTHAEQQRLLIEALPALTPRERAAVTLCCIEGRPTGETADALGITAGTVRSLLSTARAKLRAAIENASRRTYS